MVANQIVKDRIKLFIAHLDVTNQAFEKACGLSNGYIANMRKGVGDYALEQISKKYPELNTTWLLTGDGAMLNESPKELHKVADTEIGNLLAAIRQHGEELRKQGERLDRVLDLVSRRESGVVPASSQVGDQKSPPLGSM